MLDPTLEEEKDQQGSVMVAFMPSLNQVTQLFQTGEVSPNRVQEVEYPFLFWLIDLGHRSVSGWLRESLSAVKTSISQMSSYCHASHTLNFFLKQHLCFSPLIEKELFFGSEKMLRWITFE